MKLEVHQIRALKGQRQLTQLLCTTPDQAAAAESAGIEIIVSGGTLDIKAIRAAAPQTHLCWGLAYGAHATAQEALRDAFAALEGGADSIYCAMDYPEIAVLARQGVPVVGHVGLVPQKHRLTGFRAFGKTAADARAVWAAVQRYEEAGAWAVEMEIVAAPVATAIARATPLTVISMGSGGDCDVQYLFATDVLGENNGRMPRHARAWDDFNAEYARLQARRVTAMAAFRADVLSGAFPGPGQEIRIPQGECDAFLATLPQRQES